MRKTIVSLVFMLLSLGAWAQYAQSDALKRSGVHLSLNGETLSPEAQAALLSNIGGTDYTALWEEARSSRALGTGLTIGGGVAALGGLSCVMIGFVGDMTGAAVGGIIGSIGGEKGAKEGAEEGSKAGSGFVTGGLIATCAGLAAMGVGITKIVKSGKKLDGIVSSYNNGNSVTQVTLGPTSNGFGISLMF